MAKILVVDDRRDARDVFAELLKTRGHHVSVARDGNEAAAIIAERLPDLVLLDMLVQGQDGFELIRLIRSRWPKVRIIASAGALLDDAAVDALRRAAPLPAYAGELELPVDFVLRGRD